MDDKYGKLSMRHEDAIESWMVHAEFKRAGKTSFVLESSDGQKRTFDIIIKRNSFTVKEKGASGGKNE